ncbi:MAG: hypothetical protein CME31_23835 [Gimesia sp.]|uniref:Uncharacterized protein n=1 Tax=Gimesia maris TaxID=122 RepID=A0A3D3RIA2_9PLAN|nr:hypothetical protein [Gimesia sp.]HCO27360.1 hypothetical protein [Gimesia maris]
MKLIRLFMIVLLLQPCPVCWGHGFAAQGESVQHESGDCKAVSTACFCCARWNQRQGVQQQLPLDEEHECPCTCHVSDEIFASVGPVVHLESCTHPVTLVVNLDQSCHFVTHLNDVANDTSQAAVILPLRL